MVPPELLIIYTLISQTWEKTNRRNQSRQRIIKTQRFIDVLVKLKYNSRVLGVLFHLPKLLLHVGRFTKRGKKYQSGVRSILMPRTFHIAHLNRHTRKISGVPLKVTWCQGLGVQSLCHPVCTNNIQMFLKIPETSGFEHQAVLFVMNLQTNRGIKIELEEMQRGML